jgi:predicted ester cyclase
MKQLENARSDGDLPANYRAYLTCLNNRELDHLGAFVHDQVEYNGEQVGLSGYRKMLERDFRQIPDVRFNIQLFITQGSTVASRLAFDCTPVGRFLDLEVNGRRISFCENVFYQYEDERIRRVWSVIDKAAIEAQLESHD